MHRHERRRANHEPRHRPSVIEMSVEACDRQLGDVRAGVGMIPRELGAVVSRAERAQQGRCPRMVQVRVVEDRQAGIPEEVGPLVVVVRGVADLVDGEVVRLLLVAPHKLMGGARARCDARHGLVHEDVDLMVGAEGGDEVRAARRDAGRHGRHGAEPGQTGHPCIVRPRFEARGSSSSADSFMASGFEP